MPRIFHGGKKKTQIRQISRKNTKLPDFYDKSQQQVAKNIEGSCFIFSLGYLVCSQIWLNYFWMIITLAIYQNTF
jgi:hypothetical protein